MQKNFLAPNIAGAGSCDMVMAHANQGRIAMRLAGLWKRYPSGAQPAVKNLSLEVYNTGRSLPCWARAS